MNMKDKLIGAGAVLLAFGGLGSAAAFASTPSPPAVHTKTTVKQAVAPDPVSATDNDTTQSGDQTTPDVPGVAEAPDPNEKPDAKEAPGTETKDANETGSDGPGGHADPAGQVDNQQGGKN